MSKSDVRKEQIALLRFEKQLEVMADTLADGAQVAKSTDEKLGTTSASQAYDEMKAALIKLAEVTSKAHDSLTNKALNANRRFIETTFTKGPISRVVESKLSSS